MIAKSFSASMSLGSEWQTLLPSLECLSPIQRFSPGDEAYSVGTGRRKSGKPAEAVQEVVSSPLGSKDTEIKQLATRGISASPIATMLRLPYRDVLAVLPWDRSTLLILAPDLAIKNRNDRDDDQGGGDSFRE
jgi:hypothetical protein